eukprot:1374773-Rhodomonas_salina.1
MFPLSSVGVFFSKTKLEVRAGRENSAGERLIGRRDDESETGELLRLPIVTMSAKVAKTADASLGTSPRRLFPSSTIISTHLFADKSLMPNHFCNVRAETSNLYCCTS